MTDKNLKPFNLERALAGDPVVTVSGIKVLELKYFEKCDQTWNLICILDQSVSRYKTKVVFLDKNGNASCQYDQENYQLFMAPKTKKLWIAVENKSNSNGDGSYHFASAAHSSKFHAKNSLVSDHQIIEIEIEV